MQSLAVGVLFPEIVGKIISVSGCARSHLYSIVMIHTQRQILMMDPNWSRGFYHDGVPPHSGMKLAQEIATVTYRRGPDWQQRFARRRADPKKQPALSRFSDRDLYRPCREESMMPTACYVSKAMDLLDLGKEHQVEIARLR